MHWSTTSKNGNKSLLVVPFSRTDKGVEGKSRFLLFYMNLPQWSLKVHIRLKSRPFSREKFHFDRVAFLAKIIDLCYSGLSNRKMILHAIYGLSLKSLNTKWNFISLASTNWLTKLWLFNFKNLSQINQTTTLVVIQGGKNKEGRWVCRKVYLINISAPSGWNDKSRAR